MFIRKIRVIYKEKWCKNESRRCEVSFYFYFYLSPRFHIVLPHFPASLKFSRVFRFVFFKLKSMQSQGQRIKCGRISYSQTKALMQTWRVRPRPGVGEDVYSGTRPNRPSKYWPFVRSKKCFESVSLVFKKLQRETVASQVFIIFILFPPSPLSWARLRAAIYVSGFKSWERKKKTTRRNDLDI